MTPNTPNIFEKAFLGMKYLLFGPVCVRTVDEYNILIGNVNRRERHLLFGPLEYLDVFQVAGGTDTFPKILKRLEIFDSIAEAKRRGWDKEIPEGFSRHRVKGSRKYGSNRTCDLTIMKRTK